jgi:hypothetical protein
VKLSDCLTIGLPHRPDPLELATVKSQPYVSVVPRAPLSIGRHFPNPKHTLCSTMYFFGVWATDIRVRFVFS